MHRVGPRNQSSNWDPQFLAPALGIKHGWRNLFQSGGTSNRQKSMKFCGLIGNCGVTSIETWRH